MATTGKVVTSSLIFLPIQTQSADPVICRRVGGSAGKAVSLLFSWRIPREKKQKRRIGAQERTRTSTDCSTDT